jgi:hypothetical protein
MAGHVLKVHSTFQIFDYSSLLEYSKEVPTVGIISHNLSKIVQMTPWESYQLIVPVKRGNGREGKGLAGVRWTDRDTHSIPQRWARGVNETVAHNFTSQRRSDSKTESKAIQPVKRVL